MLTIIWTLICALVFAVPVPTSNICRMAAKDMKSSVVLHIKGLRPDFEKKKMHHLFITCSGTYVSPNEVLTAGHCFEDYQPIGMWVKGNTDTLGTAVQVEKIDITRDLALVKVQSPFPHAYAKLGKMPRIGDDVVAIGSPLGFEFTTTSGIVSLIGLPVNGFLSRYTVNTAMIDHGSSGGGLFDRNGRLIGVNTMSIGMFGWGGLTLSVDVGTIREFLGQDL